MFERFPEETVDSLFVARSLAGMAGSGEILPEHLVGGVLRALPDTLGGLGSAQCETIQRRLHLPVRLAAELPVPSWEIPFSAAVQRFLNDATTEADRLGQHLVRPQHLLLAILKSDSQLAVLFRDCGVECPQLESSVTAAAAINDAPRTYTARLTVGRLSE